MPDSRSYCFRVDSRQGDGQSGRPIGKEKEKKEIQPLKAIYCKVCSGFVTGRDQKISMQGSHEHTFFNPAGIVFELGCFNTAPGCLKAGEASSDFSWFPGYVWRFALCKRCKSHLGWSFEMGEHLFFGLILANLKE